MPCVQRIINDNWPKLRKISDSPILDCEILLAHVLKKPREFLYAHPNREVAENTKKKFEKLLRRRIKGEPIAYLISHKEFFGLDFYVDKRVMIPRPDTEALLEKIIKETKNKKITIVDVGTGSGCLAIALKKHLPQCEIIATDISKKALAVAGKNAKKHKVKIEFLHGDLLRPLQEKVDLIVANLPYLPKNVSRKKNLKFEPQLALRNKGQTKRLLKQAKNYLKPEGKIFLEIKGGKIKIIKVLSSYLR